MFSKAEVMKQAWVIYKEAHATYAEWQFRLGIHDGSFSGALKTAWRVLKSRAAEAAKIAAQTARELSSPYAVAIQVMRGSLEGLQYKGFGHNIRQERARIEAEIARLLEKGDVDAAAKAALGVA